MTGHGHGQGNRNDGYGHVYGHGYGHGDIGHAPAVRQTIQTAPPHHGGGGGMSVQDMIALMQFARDFQHGATHEAEHHTAMPVHMNTAIANPACQNCRSAGGFQIPFLNNPHRTTADMLWIVFVVFMIVCLFYGAKG